MAQNFKKPDMPSTHSQVSSKVEISSLRDFQKKIKFADKEVSVLVSRIVSTICTAEIRGGASIVDSLRFLLGATLELAIQYNPVPKHSLILVSPGDVVECKFGTHVDGEISGMSVHSIVCDIQDDGTVYLLPITKQILDGDARKFMLMLSPNDVSYYDPKFTGGTVLLRMGKYVRPERIKIIVGKTSPEFFESLLRAFHRSMDFSGNAPKTELLLSSGDYPALADNTHEHFSTTSTEDVPDEGTCPESSEEQSVPSVDIPQDKPKKTRKKQVPFENCLQDLLEPIWDSINDPDFGIEDKVMFFLSELNFEDKLAIVHDAFVVSCEVPRVTMPSILAALSKIHRSTDKEHLKEALIVAYDTWLAQQHPELYENYPNTSIMALLKIFAKKMK